VKEGEEGEDGMRGAKYTALAIAGEEEGKGRSEGPGKGT
jgi:hypothetical protein